ncbi:S-adenosylmethionine decarboxylase [Candidatus Bathyarchaeota archaeon]|nr:S-adenosylmethionine decarboxylase [Candidatus Bathyarchaeota archaeon]
MNCRVAMIGIHLMVDGETATRVDEDTIRHILTDLPSRIDMHILDGPHIIQGVPENPGITGIEVIDKSHISIHTFTENNTISIDVYSCKPFNAKKIVNYLKEHIVFKEISTRTITREIIPTRCV